LSSIELQFFSNLTPYGGLDKGVSPVGARGAVKRGVLSVKITGGATKILACGS
jgi:hypothetical protein